MRSDKMTKGPSAAPRLALMKVLGLTDEEIDRPLIGIVSSKNDIVPGHMNLDKVVDAVKQGVALAGGVPLVFPAIAVCDGLAMGHEGMKYSLVSRELIADSTESMAIAHPFDGLVMVAACDKNVPGLMMAAARINIPTIIVSGGPMLGGYFKGHKVTVSSVFEAVGTFHAGKMSAEELGGLVNEACPTCGSCAGMFTANSMNCMTEVLGIALPGNGTIPAVMSERIRLAKKTGMRIMDLVRDNVLPRDIMTRKAFENALMLDMALGCGFFASIFLYPPDDPEHVRRVSHQMPVIAICDKNAAPEIDLIELNNFQAGCIAAEHLLSLGHRNIAVLSSDPSRSLARSNRIRGVTDQMERSGLEDCLSVVVPNARESATIPGNNANYRIGRAIGQRQELLSGKYSAFIAINDMVAIGVIDVLSAHGIQFPRDYSIVGLDKLLYTGLSRISLTTVDHHTDILAQAAISLLLRRVDPSMEPALLSSTRFKVECTPQLVVRNSTAPLA